MFLFFNRVTTVRDFNLEREMKRSVLLVFPALRSSHRDVGVQSREKKKKETSSMTVIRLILQRGMGVGGGEGA